MSTTDTIAAVLIDYLQSALGSLGPIDAETDLLDSGRLDSLSVMDLVCFLEVRFQIRMQPADVNPGNLRSVRRLTHYVQTRLRGVADAA